MRFLYSFSVYLYGFAIFLTSFYNEKARKWLKGRRNVHENLQKAFEKNEQQLIWFHCASLGEFEMGKPVMEILKKKHPEAKLLLTFFSPSGYEIRKDYPLADHICYLPLDLPGRVKKFLDIVNPSLAVFVKYEFWFNYLNEINKRKVPLFLISAVFRRDQHFFKWYGAWGRKHLRFFNWIFTQNRDSEKFLQNIGIDKTIVSGDTRFDRVLKTVSMAKDLPMIEQFAGNAKLFVAGSSWGPDENVYLNSILNTDDSIKVVIAPHDVSESRIKSLEQKIDKKRVRYSELEAVDKYEAKVLIIDSIGILSGVYRYAHIAFVGGGFGSGLHNILEAVAFGCPVLFGPENDKFWEAGSLAGKGGAFVVENEKDFSSQFDKLIENNDYYNNCSEICRNFVKDNAGGSMIISKAILEVLNEKTEK